MLRQIFNSNLDVSLATLQNLDTLQTFSRMAMTCRAFNNVTSGTEQGCALWLKLALAATVGQDGHSSSAEIRRHFATLKGRTEFFWNLELLVCPWCADEECLPVDVGGRGDVRQTLCFSTDVDRLHYSANNNSKRLSFPSVPIDGFENMVQTFDETVLPVVAPLSQTMQDLAKKAREKKIVPDFSHDQTCQYRVFPVHAGAFAVVELFFSGVFNDDKIIDDGVYFFSHKDGRMLRHIALDSGVSRSDCVILSKPCALWIMTYDGIRYFGPSCSRREYSYGEFMDPALWAIGRGDAEAAIKIMNNLEAPLDWPCLISDRTLLHYAAKEGHVDAVRRLLACEEFEAVNTPDAFGHSALYLAVAELRLEVVEVLLELGNADPEGSVYIFNDIGDFCQYRPYAKCTHRAKLEFNHLVPAITKLILDKSPGILDECEGITYYKPVLTSPKTIRLICSAGEETSMDYFTSGFAGGFRTREHALSAVSSLYVLAREFNLDINTKEYSHMEYPLINLAENAIVEAVIMAIDNLGADPTVKSKKGQTIREIATARASVAGDEDGRRMLSFLDSRGL
jgi:ankyrin repeat protein